VIAVLTFVPKSSRGSSLVIFYVVSKLRNPDDIDRPLKVRSRIDREWSRDREQVIALGSFDAKQRPEGGSLPLEESHVVALLVAPTHGQFDMEVSS
jgi:hypothetical protein